MAISAERAQDVGRTHRRSQKAIPRVDPRNSVIGTYQRTMREELWGILRQLQKDAGLSLAEREKRWKLAILLARELGADMDTPKRSKPTSIGTVPHDTAAPEF